MWMPDMQLFSVDSMVKSTGPIISLFNVMYTMDNNEATKYMPFGLSVSGNKLYRRRVFQAFQKGSDFHYVFADFSRIDKDSVEADGDFPPELKDACVTAREDWLAGILKVKELKKLRSRDKEWSYKTIVNPSKREVKQPQRYLDGDGEDDTDTPRTRKSKRKTSRKISKKDDESPDDIIGIFNEDLLKSHERIQGNSEKNKQKMREMEKKIQDMEKLLVKFQENKRGVAVENEGGESTENKNNSNDDDDKHGKKNEKKRKKKRKRKYTSPPPSSPSSCSSSPKRTRHHRGRKRQHDSPQSTTTSSSSECGDLSQYFQMKLENNVLKNLVTKAKKRAYRRGKKTVRRSR